MNLNRNIKEKLQQQQQQKLNKKENIKKEKEKAGIKPSWPDLYPQFYLIWERNSTKFHCPKNEVFHLRIWSHLLKKSLMENFIFVQCSFS